VAASGTDASVRSARLSGTLLSKMGFRNAPLGLRCMPTLRDIVYENVREGELYEKLDRNRVRCFACGHCCPISEGQPGVCKVRYNQGGTLYVSWGYAGVVQCDPIEKKPFFHAYPGALAYSFGMLGCDLHCSYCQNWVTSQALRDPTAVGSPLAATLNNWCSKLFIKAPRS
jgi:pyruvate formate lyase activating enzyme